MLQVALITGPTLCAVSPSICQHVYGMCKCAHVCKWYVCVAYCVCTFYIINHVMFQNAVMFRWLARQMPGQGGIKDNCSTWSRAAALGLRGGRVSKIYMGKA